MSTRSGDRRLLDHEGLLTVEEVSAPRDRPGPGERLRKELAEIDIQQGEEGQRRAEQRRELTNRIADKTEERAGLLEQAEKLKAEVENLRSQFDQLPDEASERFHRTAHRLSAFGRVLRTEVHLVNDMLDAFARYQTERRRWRDEVAATPELEESRQLVEFHTAQPDSIAELPEVLRGIIERQLANAREALSARGKPTRPNALAPLYECVVPSPDGGSVVVVVIPATCDALRPGHPQAPFVAEVLAAMSRALLEETDADAPTLLCPDGDDPLRGTIVVGVTCGTDALDADLFGVRVQEILAESEEIGVEVLPIDDADLSGALGDIVRKAVEAR